MLPLGKNTQFAVRSHSYRPGDSGSRGKKHKVRKQNLSKIQSLKKTEEAVGKEACISMKYAFKNKLCFLLYGCAAEWQLLSFPSWLQQAEGGVGGILNPRSWQEFQGVCNTKRKEQVIKHHSKVTLIENIFVFGVLEGMQLQIRDRAQNVNKSLWF